MRPPCNFKQGRNYGCMRNRMPIYPDISLHGTTVHRKVNCDWTTNMSTSYIFT